MSLSPLFEETSPSLLLEYPASHKTPSDPDDKPRPKSKEEPPKECSDKSAPEGLKVAIQKSELPLGKLLFPSELKLFPNTTMLPSAFSRTALAPSISDPPSDFSQIKFPVASIATTQTS